MGKRRKPRYVKTDEEFRDSCYDYLDFVDEINKPRFVVYDLGTGREYESVEDAMKNGVAERNIQTEFEQVPVYDIVKPTLSGYCKYMGISQTAYYGWEKKWVETGEWFRTALLSEVESLLLNPANRNSAGAKMVAINRHGWSDKTEVATSGTKEIEIIYDIPKVDNET